MIVTMISRIFIFNFTFTQNGIFNTILEIKFRKIQVNIHMQILPNQGSRTSQPLASTRVPGGLATWSASKSGPGARRRTVRANYIIMTCI